MVARDFGVMDSGNSAGKRGRTWVFLASLLAHGIGISAVLILGATGALRPSAPKSAVLTWVAPVPEPEINRPVQPPKYKAPLIAPAFQAPATVESPLPPMPAPQIASLPPVPKISVETRTPSLPLPEPEPPARPAVKTGVFTTRETPAATATPKLAIQVGEFAQVAAEKSAPRRTVAESGAFGAVAAAPARTSANAVASSGFGGVAAAANVAGPGVRQVAAAGFGGAVPGPVTRAGGAQAATGAFGNVQTAAPPAAPREAVKAGGFRETVIVEAASAPAATRSERPETAVTILEKPRPAYTEEARRLKIEGEVWLEIQFSASGGIRVLRVVKSLGHGLDESAAHAAQSIRLRPALRGGAPVDSVAIARISFQLAY